MGKRGSGAPAPGVYVKAGPRPAAAVNRVGEASKLRRLHEEIAFYTSSHVRLGRLLKTGAVVVVKPYDSLRVESLRRALMLYTLWRQTQLATLAPGDLDSVAEELERRLPPNKALIAGFRMAGVAPVFYAAPQPGADYGTLSSVFGEPPNNFQFQLELAAIASATGVPVPSVSAGLHWASSAAEAVRQGMPVFLLSWEYESITYSEEELNTATGPAKKTRTELGELIEALAAAPPAVRRHSTVLIFVPDDRLLSSDLEASMVSEVHVYPGAEEYEAILREYGVEDLEEGLRAVRGLLLGQVAALPGLERGAVDYFEATMRKRTGHATEIVLTEAGLDGYVYPGELVEYLRRILVGPLRRGENPARILVVVGPPGSGRKTLVKAVAHEAGLPVLRIRVDKLFGKYVGESEKNMAAALRDAERVGGVLMVSDVDVMFAAEGGGEGGEITQRLIGMLAEELLRPDRRFTAAFTAERVDRLPPQFMNLMTDVNVVLFFLDHDLKVRMMKYYLERLAAGHGVSDEALGELADHYMLALATARDIEQVVRTAAYLAGGGRVEYHHLVSALQYRWSSGDEKLAFLEHFEDTVKRVPSYLPLIRRYMAGLKDMRVAARRYKEEVRRGLAGAV